MKCRGELEVWNRRFRKVPPGDHVTHKLLASLGVMVEAYLTGGKPDVSRWFFWEDLDRMTAEDSDREEGAEWRSEIVSEMKDFQDSKRPES